MDREVLFRGKRESDGKWLYGLYSDDYVHDTDFPCIMPLRTEKDDGDWAVLRETVGQYTGLNDKNGNKIFEGDILKCHDNPKDLVKVVFDEFGVVDTDTELPVDTVIGWHYEVIPTDELSTVEPFCLSMPLTKSYIEYCHMEVIGNIHDDSDLLEVSE